MPGYHFLFFCLSAIIIIQINSFHQSFKCHLVTSSLNAKKMTDEEWNKIKIAIEENKDKWLEALNSKKQEWRNLKSSGVLATMTDESVIDEEALDEIDRKLGVVKVVSKIKSPLKASNTDADVNDDDDETNDEEEEEEEEIYDDEDDESTTSASFFDSAESARANSVLKFLKSKYATINSNTTTLSLISFLNEIKDKKVYDIELLESLLFSILKLKSPLSVISAFKTYYKLAFQDNVLIPTDGLFTRFVNSCFISNLAEVSEKLAKILIDDNRAVERDFFVGRLCLQIQSGLVSNSNNNIDTPTSSSSVTDNQSSSSVTDNQSSSTTTPTKSVLAIKRQRNSKTTSSSSGSTTEYQSQEVKELTSECRIMLEQEFYANLKSFSIAEINSVIRVLGRCRQTPEIFSLFRRLKTANIQPNDESYEFLSAALVATVEEEAVATAMNKLPLANKRKPEIVFAGRSNVGKSSLVNFLVNRKTLASTSSTPGHTSQFHFFGVNNGRTDLPSFRLVDVPGLGYAVSEGNIQDSWKSLLERYVSVREPLAAVFHLIDARHKVTSTDSELIELMKKAAAERNQYNRPPVAYVVVLTKIDKATAKALTSTRKAVSDIYYYNNNNSIDSDNDQNKSINMNTSIKDTHNNNKSSSMIIVETSATERVGREQLWEIILKILDDRHRLSIVE